MPLEIVNQEQEVKESGMKTFLLEGSNLHASPNAKKVLIKRSQFNIPFEISQIHHPAPVPGFLDARTESGTR